MILPISGFSDLSTYVASFPFFFHFPLSHAIFFNTVASFTTGEPGGDTCSLVVSSRLEGAYPESLFPFGSGTEDFAFFCCELKWITNIY